MAEVIVKNALGEEVVIPPKDEEEIALEKLVFGDLEGFEENLKKIENLYDYSSDEDLQDSDGLLKDSDETSDLDSDMENIQDEDLFFIDEGAAPVDDKMEVDGESQDESSAEEDDNSDNAWSDSDDERLKPSLFASDKLRKLRKRETDSFISGRSYIQRLRSQFEKIYPKPEWVDKLNEDAETDSENEVDEEESSTNANENDTNAILKILNTTEQFVMTKQMKLIAPNRISISRLTDANHLRRSKSAVLGLSFHSTHPLLLTGGFDRTLRVYHIDGKANNLVTSLHLRNSPISTCYFSPLDYQTKNLVYAGGRRRYMNKWNLDSGDVEKISRMYGQEYQRSMEYFKISSKGTFIGMTGGSGWCNILNGATGQFIKGFKIDGTIIDLEFASDETYVMIINTAGEVWEYALNQDVMTKPKKNQHHGTVLRRWQDFGGIGITKIKLGGKKDRWLAIGTNNGLVNLYDRNTFVEGVNPTPFKTVENLVTAISSLNFTPDGQVLCIASRGKRDALKLVHLPSATVYSNWPTSGTPLGRVTSTAFSPNGQMLAIGNEGGKVTLWRLNHY